MRKKILITGGAGYIGSSVSYFLLDKGFDVTIIDNLETGSKLLIPKKAKLEVCDIADKKKISNILKKNKFEGVLHFAGLIRVEESMQNPKKYYEYNYKKAKIFFDTCVKNGVKNFIFSSTAAVYGNPSSNKVNELQKLNPINPYAISKMKVENYLINLKIKKKIKFVILRYFNVAGADMKLRTGQISKNPTHLIKVICDVATNKRKKIMIYGNDYSTKDGTPERDFIHISDLSEIHFISLIHLLKNGLSQIFNCGYGNGYSVKKVINITSRVIKKKIPYKFGPRRIGDSKRVVADATKFKNFFRWKPKFNKLETIIKSSLRWEKKLDKLLKLKKKS